MRNEEDYTSEATANMQAVAPQQTNQLNTSSVLPVSLADIKLPNNLNLKDNVIENWKSYKQRWKNYAIVANLVRQPEPFKVALFLHCLGEDAQKVYNGLLFESEEDRQNLTEGPPESVEAYITELRELMMSCNFCDCLRDTLLRDKIVQGVTNKNLRKRLLQERKLTLKK